MWGKDLTFVRKLVRRVGLAAVAGFCFASCDALAGFITEQTLTPIYSADPPFDSMGTPPRNTISVNWLAPMITIFEGDLTNITTPTLLNELFALPGQVVSGFWTTARPSS